ncbi:MAG: NADH-quinone oxidoreductase subunit A [Deltaproteobacteria bacterium]|nr:NADH-quinone oxidoreductase subunit A [Deltaproteobacteria bacterium]
MAPYVPVMLLFIIAALVAGGMFVATTYLGPKNPNPAKEQPFECGHLGEGAGKIRPSVKFYLTALLFVVFDIEAVMIYPWAVQLRSLGWTGFMTMGSFIMLVFVLLAYVWKKGALEWEK